MSHWKTEYLSKIKGLRSLIEIIFLMLIRHEKYNDENDQLTERKIRAMSLRAMKERHGIDLKSAVNLLRVKNTVKAST